MGCVTPLALLTLVLPVSSADAPQCGGSAEGPPLQQDLCNAGNPGYGPEREDAIAAARAILTQMVLDLPGMPDCDSSECPTGSPGCVVQRIEFEVGEYAGGASSDGNGGFQAVYCLFAGATPEIHCTLCGIVDPEEL
jgi:hypothetical protein